METEPCELALDKLIDEMLRYWEGCVSGVVIREAMDLPHRIGRAEFVLYAYVSATLMLERSTAFISVTLPSGVVAWTMHSELGHFASLLPHLDREARLRIPDKFLASRGW